MAVACFSGANCKLEVFNSGACILYGAFLAHCCPLQTEGKKDDGKYDRKFADDGEFEAMMRKANAEARISKLATKVEELAANINSLNTVVETNKEIEATFVKTSETHNLQRNIFFENCETKIKELEAPTAKALDATSMKCRFDAFEHRTTKLEASLTSVLELAQARAEAEEHAHFDGRICELHAGVEILKKANADAMLRPSSMQTEFDEFKDVLRAHVNDRANDSLRNELLWK